MIKGSLREELTIDTILDKVSPLEIFKHFMPYKEWSLNQACLSPIRNEKNPSFLIGNKYGEITFKDFGSGEGGDCFKFVKLLYNLPNLDSVLRKIDSDLGLGIIDGNPIIGHKIVKSAGKQEITKRNTLIQVVSRKFTTEELNYWKQYYVDIEELRKNEIYSIKKLYINRKQYPIKDTELRFGYFLNGLWKAYFPFNKDRKKWISNIPLSQMEGLESLKTCNKGIITKARKDRIILLKFLPNVASVQNESIGAFTEENVSFIRNNVQNPYINYDADSPGKSASIKITSKFGWKHLNVEDKYLKEGIKDIASLLKEKGYKVVEEFLRRKEII